MKKEMHKNGFKYHSHPDMTVGMQSQEDYNLQVLHGKVILNEEGKSLIFLQNVPRGPRSLELMRTRHSRLVRTPKGSYTLTFRFTHNEKNIRTSLMSEMESITNNELIVGKETDDEI